VMTLLCCVITKAGLFARRFCGAGKLSLFRTTISLHCTSRLICGEV
jgi:hypothetical protein